MNAVILAGGEGTRLRPLTVGRPKPLIPVVNKPILAHILDLLKRHGMRDIVIAAAYMANVIQDYFGNGHPLNLDIRYAVEERPLGTAGAVKNAAPYLHDTFLVISGDILTDFDLSRLIAFHRARHALATIALYRVANPREFGVVVTDDDGRVTQFLEKPSWGEVFSDTINAGIYVFQREILDLIPPDTFVDWSQDVFPRLLREAPDRLFALPLEGYWKDIGTIPQYIQATHDVLQQKVQLEPLGQEWAPGIWVQEEPDLGQDVTLTPPLYLGRGISLKDGVTLQGPTVLRDYVIVDNRALIERSIVWRNTYIGEGAELHGAIVGRQCSIKARSILFEGVVVGDETNVGEGAILHPGVKIWPRKEIESGAVVRESLVWGTRGRRALFGRFGITGVVNVDLTPELCAKLGIALGAIFPEGSYIVMNRDPHRSSRMLKRALIAGLPSAGINVWDTHSVAIPVARYYTRVSPAVAGLHVRLSPFDPRVVDIRVFGADGQNLDRATERAVERIFFREDFRRAPIEKIGVIADAPDVTGAYIRGFLNRIQQEAVREIRYRLVVDYAYSPNVAVLPEIFSRLHVDVIPLNAHVDESKISLAEEAQEQWQRELAKIVRALGRDLGIQLDVGGEKLFLVDDRGNILSPEWTALVVIDLAMRYQSGRAVVVPVTMTQAVEQVVGFHGGYVIRTRYDLHDLMSHSEHPDVILATDGRGHFIFPEFQPVPDALFATVKILELLSRHNTRFSDVIALLPRFHMAKAQIPCGWDQKATVMRRLNEVLRDRPMETLDGIKVWLGPNRWVLIRPDPDRPVLHVDVEAPTHEDAQALVAEYTRLVEELRGS
ncbi:MAG: NTP transferase domain-containing protein [Chloroflexi bacterium]|nr:NTP transferase domain-containing protein [Chloroflexota bacterium]